MLKAWNDLREQFEIEDGSLPDLFSICYETEEAVSEALEYLRSISKPISSTFMFHDARLGKDVFLTSVEEPARLVAKDEVGAFCLMFYGALSDQRTDFPELGVFVFPKELQFYYRPGPDWSEGSLGKLFEIMTILSKIDGSKVIESLLPDTTYYSNRWLLFERHYKQSLKAK